MKCFLSLIDCHYFSTRRSCLLCSGISIIPVLSHVRLVMRKHMRPTYVVCRIATIAIVRSMSFTYVTQRNVVLILGDSSYYIPQPDFNTHGLKPPISTVFSTFPVSFLTSTPHPTPTSFLLLFNIRPRLSAPPTFHFSSVSSHPLRIRLVVLSFYLNRYCKPFLTSSFNYSFSGHSSSNTFSSVLHYSQNRRVSLVFLV